MTHTNGVLGTYGMDNKKATNPILKVLIYV